MARELPSGTVTFLFTDVEGSTRLLHDLGTEEYASTLAEHRRILRTAFAANGGTEVDTQGDAFFIAFSTAPNAVAAATDVQDALRDGPIQVRIGIHTGTPALTDEGYVGVDVHRAARIAAVGHGGQILLSSSTARLVELDDLRDLGEHRLKDISLPERIYQVGSDEFPPLSTLYRTNLPVPATPFVGRARELSDVLGLLAQDDVRLLTLTGPGGTGKTRLALRAAAQCASGYRDGVFWVPLAPLRDPKLVFETAAQVLEAQSGLAERVADKSLLLLLDNFEHVVEAAEQLPELLSACPNLQLIVTSRELLRVPEEHSYVVPPLQPDDGRTLFLVRARAVDVDLADTEEVRQLCARLDNLPLALELAAARTRVLDPGQLLERLSQRLDLLRAGRGVDARQQTLRATIEWSYDLLDAEEKRLFATLAVFVGGCTLEAAEQVCDASVAALEALVDKSLVRVRAGGRFWMLETIREFAAEKLAVSGLGGDVRRRHTDHFLDLAEQVEPFLRGTPGEWLDRLEADQDNLRAALDHLGACGDTQRALLLAGQLQRFWMWRGYTDEGRRRFDALLAADTRPTLARARALNGAVNMTADPATALARAEEALALQTALADEWGMAYSRSLISMILLHRTGEAQRAKQMAEESAAAFRSLGDAHYAIVAQQMAARASYALGEIADGRELEEECLRLGREQGNETAVASSLRSLARYAYEEGRLADALEMLQEALLVARNHGNRLQMTRCLLFLGVVRTLRGEAEAGLQLLSFAENLGEEIGAIFDRFEFERNDQALAAAQATLGVEAFARAREGGRAMSFDEAVALALSGGRQPLVT